MALLSPVTMAALLLLITWTILLPKPFANALLTVSVAVIVACRPTHHAARTALPTVGRASVACHLVPVPRLATLPSHRRISVPNASESAIISLLSDGCMYGFNLLETMIHFYKLPFCRCVTRFCTVTPLLMNTGRKIPHKVPRCFCNLVFR